MPLPASLNFFTILDNIDAEAPSHSLDRKQAARRVFTVLATTCVCLLLIHYLKYFSSFKATLFILSDWLGHASKYTLFNTLRESQYMQLFSYCWWTFWHIVGYVLLPFLLVRFVLKERFAEMGWRWGDTHKHWLGYLALISPILFFIFLVSFRDDFLSHYPFYKQAGRSWFDFLAWEALYITQFICLEFFFRGFLLNSLRPALGANAIWIMCVPYLMIHFPKLWLEATGAILFGFFLGLLALRSRSIWGGVAVHVGIAVTMDLTSLYKQGGIASLLFPS